MDDKEEVVRGMGKLKAALSQVNRALPAYEFQFIHDEDTAGYMMRDASYQILYIASMKDINEARARWLNWYITGMPSTLKSVEEAAHNVSKKDVRAASAIEALKKTFQLASVVFGGKNNGAINWRDVDRLSGDIRAHADLAWHGSPFYRENQPYNR